MRRTRSPSIQRTSRLGWLWKRSRSYLPTIASFHAWISARFRNVRCHGHYGITGRAWAAEITLTRCQPFAKGALPLW